MEETEHIKKEKFHKRSWCSVRDNCCSAGNALRNCYCTALAKTGNQCNELKPLAHFVMLFLLLVLFLLSYGLVSAGISMYQSREINENTSIEPVPGALDVTQTASVISASTDINIAVPEDDTSKVFSKCDFNNGEWVRWFGKINQDFEDKTHFTLPVNSDGALFKYVGKIDDFSSCEFVFIPRSESSINYVISLDEIYQIVIGDNDLWTIAVRATDAIGGDLVPIKEDSSQKTRPRLLSKIKNGTNVKAVLNQKFIDDDTYQIELVISYKPDTTELNETQTSKFTWTFEPSPAILENPSLSVGLIRGSEDKSEIGVKFVNPSIVQ
jgi:hypothetical protein